MMNELARLLETAGLGPSIRLLESPAGARLLEALGIFGVTYGVLAPLVVALRRESWLLAVTLFTAGGALAWAAWAPAGREGERGGPPVSFGSPATAAPPLAAAPAPPTAPALPPGGWIEAKGPSAEEAQRLLVSRAFERWLGVGGDGSAFGRLHPEMADRVVRIALEVLVPERDPGVPPGEVGLRARENPQGLEAALAPLGFRPTASSIAFEVLKNRSGLSKGEVERRLSVLYPLQSEYYLGPGFYAGGEPLAQELRRDRFDLGKGPARIRVRDWREASTPAEGPVLRFRIDVE